MEALLLLLRANGAPFLVADCWGSMMVEDLYGRSRCRLRSGVKVDDDERDHLIVDR